MLSRSSLGLFAAALLSSTLLLAGCAAAGEGEDVEASEGNLDLDRDERCNPDEPTRDPNELLRGAVAEKDRVDVESGYARVNGTCLHYVEAGPRGGKPIVLLHGIPQFWYAWRHQIGPLARAGFRVIVPDTRGYNESAHPDDVRGYTLKNVAADVTSLMTALEVPKAVIVGHDIGGVTAWAIGMYARERVDGLIVLAAPHPGSWRRFLIQERDREQFGMSWYVFAFAALPRLTEAYIRSELPLLGGGGLLAQYDKTLRGPETGVRDPWSITDRDLATYVESLETHPKALASSFRYYEALFEPGQALQTRESLTMLAARSLAVRKLEVGALVPPSEDSLTVSFPRVTSRALAVLPEEDGYNRVDLFADAEELAPHASNVTIERLPGRSHWILEEARNEVTARILAFTR